MGKFGTYSNDGISTGLAFIDLAIERNNAPRKPKSLVECILQEINKSVAGAINWKADLSSKHDRIFYRGILKKSRMLIDQLVHGKTEFYLRFLKVGEYLSTRIKILLTPTLYFSYPDEDHQSQTSPAHSGLLGW
jgi:hypothetical protein